MNITQPNIAMPFAFLLVFVAVTSAAMCQDNDTSEQAFATLIAQLEADKASIRDKARDNLFEAGVPAIDIVLKKLLNKDSPPETRTRCVSILKAWEKKGEEKMIARLQEKFKDLNPNDYSHAKQSLAEIKELCFREIPETPDEFKKWLSDRGIRLVLRGRNAEIQFWDVLINRDWKGSLEDLRQLRYLKARFTSVRDLTSEMLPALKGLDVSSISFAQTRMREKLVKSDFEVISSFQNLSKLNLSNVEFDRDSVSPLSGNTSINRLVLSSSATDDILEIVGELSGLEYLDCRRCNKLTANGIAKLKNIKQLVEINLPTNAIGALKQSDKFTSLRSLSFGGAVVNDETIAQFKGLDNLVSLSLSRTHVRGTTINSLAELGNLQVVELDNNHFMSDLAIEQLAELPKLKAVTIMYCPITDRSLEVLAKSDLKLRAQGSLITKAAVADFVDSIGRRVSVKHRRTRETPEAMEAIQGLVARGAGMNPVHLSSRGKDGKGESWVRIKLFEGIWKGTDQDLEKLASIPYLALESNLKKSDRLVEIIIENADQIRRITVHEGSMTNSQIKKLEKFLTSDRIYVFSWSAEKGYGKRIHLKDLK